MSAPQKQVDLKSLLDGTKHKEVVLDDFAVAFLQAGIPPNKLDHPSIHGLFFFVANSQPFLVAKGTRCTVALIVCILHALSVWQVSLMPTTGKK